MGENNRTQRLLMRLTEEEKDFIKSRADMTTGNMTAYILNLVEMDRGQPFGTPDPEPEKDSEKVILSAEYDDDEDDFDWLWDGKTARFEGYMPRKNVRYYDEKYTAAPANKKGR